MACDSVLYGLPMLDRRVRRTVVREPGSRTDECSFLLRALSTTGEVGRVAAMLGLGGDLAGDVVCGVDLASSVPGGEPLVPDGTRDLPRGVEAPSTPGAGLEGDLVAARPWEARRE